MSDVTDELEYNDGHETTYRVTVELDAFESRLIDMVADREDTALADVLRRALRHYAGAVPDRIPFDETRAAFALLRRGTRAGNTPRSRVPPHTEAPKRLAS